MPKFLIRGSFTKEGVKGLTKEGGTKRRQAVEKFFGTLGGKLEVLYFAFGDTDVFAVVDFPDNVTAAAISLAGNSTAAINIRLTPLITPEEMDAAAKKSESLHPPVS